MAGSKRITGQEPLDEHLQRHGPTAEIPAGASRDPPPALHLQLGFGAWDELHPVAVLGICRLIGALDRLRLGLRAQEGIEEGGGFRGFAQGCREAPGGSGGVAVVVEVEVVLRDAGKAGEGIDGAGGQGIGADALVSSTTGSRAPQNRATDHFQKIFFARCISALKAHPCRSQFPSGHANYDIQAILSRANITSDAGQLRRTTAARLGNNQYTYRAGDIKIIQNNFRRSIHIHKH